jgi:hypothetical protein
MSRPYNSHYRKAMPNIQRIDFNLPDDLEAQKALDVATKDLNRWIAAKAGDQALRMTGIETVNQIDRESNRIIPVAIRLWYIAD